MSYSRRQLYALGEPLGDSATYRKADGGLILGDGGGGGGGTQTQVSSTTQTQDLPDWAKPYAQDVLSRGKAVTDVSQNPYQPYGGQRIQEFTPLQQQAQQGVAGLQMPSEYGAASQAAGRGIAQALSAGQYQPSYFGSQYQAPQDYAPGQFSMLQAQAPNLQQYQMGPAERVRTDQFTGQQVGQYMNPYLQYALAPQIAEANRQFDITGTRQQGAATQAGAFGGSREAIMAAENERNRNLALQNIVGQGYSQAYNQAAQQFNQQQQANLQARLANQQAGLTVGQQNLQALLGVQQLGAGQNLQAQLANQQALQAAQQAAEQSRQYGYGQGMTASQLAAQYGLAGQQATEQSRQFGAGLGLQGAQAGIQGAGQLAGIGGQALQGLQGIYGLQGQVGAQQQAQQQRALDIAYQDFLTQKNYPYQQLSYMANLVRGTPMGMNTQSQVYQAPPTGMQTLGALGLGAYGLGKMFADGGEVKTYAGDKGSVTSEDNVRSISRFLPPQQLPTSYQLAQARNDLDAQAALQKQMAENASIQRGLGSAFNALPPETQDGVVRAAGGGILAFNGDEDGNDQVSGQLISSPGNPALYNRSLQEAMDYNAAIGKFKGTTMTPEEERAYVQRQYNLEKGLAGPNEAADQFRAYLQGAEGDRAAALEQSKGLGALQAASAILQPGGTIRGLGAAGSAFAGEYSKGLQADRAMKHQLAMANFNLADAERKERMGYTKSAMESLAKRQANLQAADKLQLDVLKSQGSTAARIAQAARPIGTKGAGAGKPNPTIYSIEALAAQLQKEHSDWTPEKVKAEAVSEFNRQTKAGTSGSVASIVKESRKSVDDQIAVGPTKFKKFAADTFDGDEAAARQFLYDQALAGYPPNMYIPKGAPSGTAGGGGGGGGGNPPPPSGFVRQQ